MTTQELIKKMRDCVGCSCCFDCKHYTKKPTTTCENNMLSSAADRLAQLETQLAIVTAERDKAVKKFELFAHHYAHLCCLCKADCINAGKRIGDEDATVITQCSRFQWRGIEKDGEANE